RIRQVWDLTCCVKRQITGGRTPGRDWELGVLRSPEKCSRGNSG
ncbi:hypothetical protein A2U01_0086628, partial [Trifolium medium]|nr:hypothetical protein [Trifolium medium]